jgi:acetyl/propionyl-CoA carboxylase alpha subunit
VKILIANRGEIARCIIRTAHRMGHRSVAVFADPDAGAPFVAEATEARRIGPAALAESYLSIERILEAAVATGSDAIHPGYGFLSENPRFARAVEGSGMVWIGPHPDAIDAMGSKIEARRLAEAAGVRIIPGFDASQNPADLEAAAATIGYPVLIKASAGGGGKGIRIVSEPARFGEALSAARDESRRSFADDAVIVERYVTRPRHVEVQVVGDRHGHVFDLGTRECSVQRRYQKLMEEAPAPNLEPDTSRRIRDAAVALAEAISYDSAGTVEFVVDDETGEFFFLEMNTRLQVEHPVTECVTGLDLVELQIRAAAGEVLELGSVEPAGHAFEARINAEDAWAGFTPQVGTLTDVVLPDGVRWDSGVVEGSEVTPHYDPMIAKLVVAGRDRETARRRMAAALEGLVLGGITTNAGFHRWLIDQPLVVEGRVTTRFLDDVDLPDPPDEDAAAVRAAAIWAATPERNADPFRSLGAFRLTPHRSPRVVHLRGTSLHDVAVVDVDRTWVGVADRLGNRVVVNVAGHSHTFEVLTPTERWSPAATRGHGLADSISAPFPGVVAEVRVVPGDQVAAGDTVAVLEAMKMLHPLTAHGAGTVAEIRVAPSETVVTNQILITFAKETE